MVKPTAATSPFEKTELVGIREPYSKKAKLTALKLSNGEILINFDHNTKESVLKDLARVLGAEVVLVEGTWTFTPDTEDETE